MGGTVTGIFVIATAGGDPVGAEKAEVVAGVGLVGDRYAEGTGTYSDGSPVGRQLTLVDGDDVAAAAAAAGVAIRPGEARRNVETEGIDLQALIGHRFRVGAVECVGVRACPPCDLLDDRLGPGVKAALAGRGGLRADVVAGGIITVGDGIDDLGPV